MLGLGDDHIAHREMPRTGAGKAGHAKADGAYVFARAPDVVLMGIARGSAQPMFRSVRLPSGGKRVVWERKSTEPTTPAAP